MRYLRAGADQAYLAELTGFDVLISYAEKTQHAFIESRRRGRTPYLMLDNGAFKVWNAGKGRVDVAAYSAFILANLDGVDHAIAADVIPGRPGQVPDLEDAIAAEAATVANLEAMLAAGVPRHKLLPVLHMAMPNWRQVMARYMAMGFDFICLGGTVKAPERQIRAWLAQVFDAFPAAYDPRFSARQRKAMGVPAGGVFYHLLGLTRKWTRVLPAHSCDSTTWLQLAKNRKAQDGIKENRYVVQGLPGYYYHQAPRLGNLAADLDDHADDLDGPQLRAFGALAMGAKVPSASWLPPRGTDAWFDAVYWLQHFWCWNPDEGPFNPYAAAKNYAEDYAPEHFADLGWTLPDIAPEDEALVQHFVPRDEHEADVCGYEGAIVPYGAQLALPMAI